MPSRPVRSRRSWATWRVIRCCPRMPPVGVRRCACPRRLSPAACPTASCTRDLLHPSCVEYAITVGVRAERREMVVAGLGRSERQFSERDRDVLDLVRPDLEAALRDAQARERLVRALATTPAPGTAVVLLDRYGELEHSSLDAERSPAEPLRG